MVPSVARKINRETVVVLGWGRAILMQLAHPLVAAGVAEHSEFGTGVRDYVRRARRTIGAMLTLTFGTDDEARAVVARINEIHDRVKGPTYSARDPRLLCWVHATLLDSIPLAYELFVGPLTRDERDRYCEEAVESAHLFGIPEGMPPRNVAELDCYMSTMLASGELSVTDRARTLSRALLSSPLGPAGAPFFHLARLTTIGLLPEAIREGYGFRWSPRQERRLRRAAAVVRSVRPYVPALVREWPAARRASAGSRER